MGQGRGVEDVGEDDPSKGVRSAVSAHLGRCGSQRQVLAGVMHVTGQLSDGIEPFTTRFRIEFHDEADERTRLEIRQWLPEDLAGPQRAGLARGIHQTGRHAENRPGHCGRSSKWSNMGKLIYVTNVSLDGYIEDEHGTFDLYAPDDDVFACTINILRSAGTFIYGRRLYQTMAVWETNAALVSQSKLTADLRDRLAGGEQDRLLNNPRHGVNREDAA